MRTADLFRLALAALWQQKTRTVLTTIGVTLGSCMLAFSLSIGQGVQDAMDRQFRARGDFRRIAVYAARVPADADETGIPPSAIEVKGEMSAEKRQRIRKLLAREWHSLNTHRPPVPLNRDLIDRINGIQHVESVNPIFYEAGRMVVGDRSISASIRPFATAQMKDSRQIVAGAMPSSDDEKSILVHEFLLYQLGIRDDAALARAIGQPIRLQLYNHYRSPKVLMLLFDAQATTLTSDESLLLEKAVQRLPQALDRLDMTPEERRGLQKLLQRRDVLAAPPEQLMVAEEFKLAGVFRDPTPDEEKEIPFYERINRLSDVMIPQGSGMGFCEKLPRRREEGYNGLTVVVDQEENVRPVVDELKRMGLENYSAIEFIEQVLREIRLIRFATSFIAAVALLVAGLGITNTMVTGVLERTQEIGIMKAVGARSRQILSVFLIEGVLLGVIGSGLGILGAWLLSIPGEDYARKLMEQQTHNMITQQLFVFPVWLLVSVPVFVMVVTALAALYPARRAAQVDPIVALRHE
jgi:putative ABC transport system permease protein